MKKIFTSNITYQHSLFIIQGDPRGVI